MSATAPELPAPAEPAPLARLREVTKRYGQLAALDRFSLTLRRGEVTALLGPNGAGKTTAVRLLLGLMRPDAGAVEVLGRDPRSSQARTAIGAMLQGANAPDSLSVREHIELFRSYYPRPLATAELLKRTGLALLEHRRFGALSGGQRQRMLFALAICGDPEVVILDEPTVGLDIQTRRQVWSEVRALAAAGKAVLLTTHYLEEADALAHRIVLIERGRVVRAGTPHEIKHSIAARRIRCRTRLPAAALRALPTVTGVEADRDGVVIFAHEPEQVLREMLPLDETLSDLEVSAASLEDAFLALTHTS
ncbi:MAG: ABC transporter ATP-binding protein [Pseudomonadota bacterium]|jgi:ABC-2 type transport system ATP-binding protein|nr:ABC transporter ATP-binding protein [Pseudomonadota bacterium]